MKKCEVSITATFAEDRINVEGRRDFTGSRNMDEVLSTCAGAISTVLDIFFPNPYRTCAGDSKAWR